MPFTVATYNVLASAYIQRAWYRRTPALALTPAWRVPALVQHISNLGAESFVFRRSSRKLSLPCGRRSASAATAANTRANLPRDPTASRYFIGARFLNCSARACSLTRMALARRIPVTLRQSRYCVAPTAYSALSIRISCGTRLEQRPAAQIGLRQARQLLTEYESCAADARGWIISGDFNVTPQSEIVALMEQAGFRYAHCDLPDVYTCNIGAKARLIDYLFHSAKFYANPLAPTRIDDKTILPSASEPSDHVALMATFNWKD